MTAPDDADVARVRDAIDAALYDVAMLAVPDGRFVKTGAWIDTAAIARDTVTAMRRAQILALAADAGAETMTDYCQENHPMPESRASTRGCQWIQLWASDYSHIIWDARTAVPPGEDQFDAAKQFMAFHGYDELPMTVHSDTWTNRWSGWIIRNGDDYRIDGTYEFLRYLKHKPNPALPVPPRRPVIAVISETKDRAATIADCLGIDTPWLFGDGMADELEGLRADRILIDATSRIDGNFAPVTRAASLKTPGCSLSFVSVRNDRV